KKNKNKLKFMFEIQIPQNSIHHISNENQSLQSIKLNLQEVLEKASEEGILAEDQSNNLQQSEQKDKTKSEQCNSVQKSIHKQKNKRQAKAKKMPWTDEQDQKIIELVQEHGPQKWTYIAEHIPGRIGKQCRERWYNHLNPEINKFPWQKDEEWILFLCHRHFGNKWAYITRYLRGRTDNAIKNHWNSSMKKRIPEFMNRYKDLKEKNEKIQYSISEQFKQQEIKIMKFLENDKLLEQKDQQEKQEITVKKKISKKIYKSSKKNNHFITPKDNNNTLNENIDNS
ncbi:myb-like DNA-binding domain protein, partial [Ichthyophthirius multifiliis]